MKPRIREAIVVEGRDDEVAVLAAVDACVICTSGYGIRKGTLELIETACKRTGIVILTDPDHAGESIRKKLSRKFPEAKQAYIARGDAYKDGDVGVENAPPAAIINALKAAGAAISSGNSSDFQYGAPEGPEDRIADLEYSFHTPQDSVTRQDMFKLGLGGGAGSAELRSRVGSVLGIGSANAKTFLKRLNAFGISREELEKACEKSRPEQP